MGTLAYGRLRPAKAWGMPDTIRARSGGCAHPRQGGFLAAIGATAAAIVTATWPDGALAEQDSLDSFAALHDSLASAFAEIDRHEIAALALTLGLLFFAV